MVVALRLRCFLQPAHQARLVVDVLALAAIVDVIRHLAVALVGLGARSFLRCVDRQLQVVGTDAVALGVRVRQGAALQHLVVGKIDAVDQHASTEGRLLGFREDVVRVFIEHHAARRQQRELVFRPALGVVQRVEVELGMLAVGHDLDTEFPFRIVAAFDCLVEVARGVAGVVGLDLGRLLRGEIAHALARLPVEADQVGHAFVVHQLVGVDAGTFHLAVVGRDAPWALDPCNHVQRFRVVRNEIVETPRFLLVGHRVRLEGVDHVRELDCVADEEDLQVVADQVPVALDGFQFHRKAARVAGRFRRFLAANHCREAHEGWRLDADFGEYLGARVLGGGFVADLAIGLEIAVGAGAARMDHAFGDAFAVEVGDLFDELVVLERSRAALTDGAQRLVVAHGMALARGQDGTV